MRRLVAFITTLAALAVILSGCSKVFKEKDLAGAWYFSSGRDYATISFDKESKSFSAEGFVLLNGTWHLSAGKDIVTLMDAYGDAAELTPHLDESGDWELVYSDRVSTFSFSKTPVERPSEPSEEVLVTEGIILERETKEIACDGIAELLSSRKWEMDSGDTLTFTGATVSVNSEQPTTYSFGDVYVVDDGKRFTLFVGEDEWDVTALVFWEELDNGSMPNRYELTVFKKSSGERSFCAVDLDPSAYINGAWTDVSN